MAETTFDYMIEHPLTLRILNWESAEGWKTFAKIATRLPIDELKPMEEIFRQARKAGFLRSAFHPLIQISMVSQICVAYLSSLPLFQLLISDEDLDTQESLSKARKYVVEATVRGMTGED